MSNLFILDDLSLIIPVIWIWMIRSIMQLTIQVLFKPSQALLVKLRYIPNNVSKDPQLTDTLNKSSWGCRSDHVVCGQWWMNSIHHDISISLWRWFNTFQERNNIFSVDIISTAFSLRFDHELCWCFHSLLKSSFSFSGLKQWNVSTNVEIHMIVTNLTL